MSSSPCQALGEPCGLSQQTLSLHSRALQSCSLFSSAQPFIPTISPLKEHSLQLRKTAHRVGLWSYCRNDGNTRQGPWLILAHIQCLQSGALYCHTSCHLSSRSTGVPILPGIRKYLSCSAEFPAPCLQAPHPNICLFFFPSKARNDLAAHIPVIHQLGPAQGTPVI